MDSYYLEMRFVGDKDDEYSQAPLDIQWSWQRENADGTVDYTVSIAVERGTAYGMHRMKLYGFDPRKHNMLGLLKHTMDQLAIYQMENGS